MHANVTREISHAFGTDYSGKWRLERQGRRRKHTNKQLTTLQINIKTEQNAFRNYRFVPVIWSNEEEEKSSKDGVDEQMLVIPVEGAHTRN